jgi:alanyl-tRNA synthetase
LFRIVSESGVAAGIRRIEAVTGQGALDVVAERERLLLEAEDLLGAQGVDVADRLRALFDRQKKLERELESLKAKATSGALDGLLSLAVNVGGIKVVAGRLDGVDARGLRDAVDLAKQKLTDAVVVLATGGDGKVSLIAGVSGVAQSKVKAGDVLSHVARQIGGKGGGRADLAQGGGEDSPRVAEALASVPAWVSEHSAGS